MNMHGMRGTRASRLDNDHSIGILMPVKPSNIRLRLLLSFTLVSSFAIIATLAASYSFHEVSQVLQSITTQRLPAALSAGNLARSAERIVAIAPRLLNVQDPDEQADVRRQLKIESEGLNNLLAKLRVKLATQDFEILSPAVATLQENLNELDAVVSVTLQLAAQREGLLKQLEQDYVAFERGIAPRLLRTQARLQQLQNAADKDQSVNIFELAKATREVQPLQQLQLEVQTLRDSLLQIANESEQSNLSLLVFPLERSRERVIALLEQLPIDSTAALRPQVKLIFQYLSGSQSILGARAEELAIIERGHRFAEENKVLSERLTEAVDNLVNNTLGQIDDANNEALKVQRKGQFFMYAVVLLALSCSMLIVWLYVDRRIVRRLQLLSENMSSIADGNLQEEIVDDSSDEIARMAHDLEVFRQTAIEVEQYNLDEINAARVQLNNAIESISEGFCLFDENDKLVLQNNHYRELFGLNDSHIGSSFETLLKRALESRIESDQDKDQYFKNRLTHHRNPPGPYVQKLKDGSWIRITERKTENNSTVAIYSDITEIKQHEQALDLALIERAKTLGNLEAVMNAIDYGILFLDKDLNVGSSNRAFHQIWELDRNEIKKAKNYNDILNLNYGDSVIRPAEESFEEYVEKRIAEIKNGSMHRHEISTVKGKIILHQCVAIPDGSRMLTYFDITQMKEVEAALRQSRERYALALSGANEALWEWVPDVNEVYVSQRFHEIADIPAKQERLSGEQWVSLVHPDDRKHVHEVLVKHMKGQKEYFDVEYRILSPDKHYHWIQQRGAGLRRDDGWIYRMAGSLGEIGARKHLEFALRDAKETAEQNSRFKSQFIANMSHELRTPLNAIIGITEMLREDVEEDGPEAFHEPLTRVSRAGKHLLNLINDVLDLSRIEAGKLALYPEHVEIETLLNDAITTTQHLIQQNNNRMHLEVTDEVKSIYSDPLRFRQIVLNLLTNASKFTQNGDIYLNACRETADDGDWLELVIRDTGIGMESDFLDKLFVEFTQEDSSATRRFGGTGLGLTISQRLCDMMGGKISVDSCLGVGTTFTVRLPAIPSSYSNIGPIANQA